MNGPFEVVRYADDLRADEDYAAISREIEASKLAAVPSQRSSKFA